MNTIEQYTYEGDGLQLVFDKGEWVVGIKNYKSANDIENLKIFERHNKTDEQFILLQGSCTLLVLDGQQVVGLKMETGKVYNIPTSIWHTTIMKPGTKMVLIERSGTSLDNSDLLELTEAQIQTSRELVLDLDT